jgi:hypothetical protein
MLHRTPDWKGKMGSFPAQTLQYGHMQGVKPYTSYRKATSAMETFGRFAVISAT